MAANEQKRVRSALRPLIVTPTFPPPPRPMHSSGVLLVHPHHYHSSPGRSPVDMSGAKLNLTNMRHYSLDSPSLTSPPAYDILLPGHGAGTGGGVDPSKHPCPGFSTGPIGAMGSQNSVMGTPLSLGPSSQFNPHLVMAPTYTAPPGLLHNIICEYDTAILHAGLVLFVFSFTQRWSLFICGTVLIRFDTHRLCKTSRSVQTYCTNV